MTLIQNRVKECFWLFSQTLPIGQNQTNKLIDTFGEDISKALPQLITKMSDVCFSYPEDFEGYLEFISEAIQYMKGETDDLPDVDVSDYNQMITQMRVQLGEYTKSSA